MSINLIKSIFKIGIIVSFIFDANFSQQKINFSGVSDSNSKEEKKMKKNRIGMEALTYSRGVLYFT